MANKRKPGQGQQSLDFGGGPGKDNVTGERYDLDIGVSPDLGDLIQNMEFVNSLLDDAEAKFQAIGDTILTTTQRQQQLTRATELFVAQTQRIRSEYELIASAAGRITSFTPGTPGQAIPQAMGGAIPGTAGLPGMPGWMQGGVPPGAYGGISPGMIPRIGGEDTESVLPARMPPGGAALQYEQSYELAKNYWGKIHPGKRTTFSGTITDSEGNILRQGLGAGGILPTGLRRGIGAFRAGFAGARGHAPNVSDKTQEELVREYIRGGGSIDDAPKWMQTLLANRKNLWDIVQDVNLSKVPTMPGASPNAAGAAGAATQLLGPNGLPIAAAGTAGTTGQTGIISNLLTKIPGAAALATRIPGIAGLLGLGGTGAAGAGAAGAGGLAGFAGGLGTAAGYVAGPVMAALAAYKAANYLYQGQTAMRAQTGGGGILSSEAGFGGSFVGLTMDRWRRGITNLGLGVGGATEVQDALLNAGYMPYQPTTERAQQIGGGNYYEIQDFLEGAYTKGLTDVSQSLDIYQEVVEKAGGNTANLSSAIENLSTVAETSNASFQVLVANYKENLESMVQLGASGGAASLSSVIAATAYANSPNPALRSYAGPDMQNTAFQALLANQFGIDYTKIPALMRGSLGVTLSQGVLGGESTADLPSGMVAPILAEQTAIELTNRFVGNEEWTATEGESRDDYKDRLSLSSNPLLSRPELLGQALASAGIISPEEAQDANFVWDYLYETQNTPAAQRAKQMIELGEPVSAVNILHEDEGYNQVSSRFNPTGEYRGNRQNPLTEDLRTGFGVDQDMQVANQYLHNLPDQEGQDDWGNGGEFASAVERNWYNRIQFGAGNGRGGFKAGTAGQTSKLFESLYKATASEGNIDQTYIRDPETGEIRSLSGWQESMTRQGRDWMKEYANMEVAVAADTTQAAILSGDESAKNELTFESAYVYGGLEESVADKPIGRVRLDATDMEKLAKLIGDNVD